MMGYDLDSFTLGYRKMAVFVNIQINFRFPKILMIWVAEWVLASLEGLGSLELVYLLLRGFLLLVQDSRSSLSFIVHQQYTIT
jgi:hypothetical protein